MSFINKDYDWRGQVPGILKRAAVRTTIMAVIALVALVGLAYAAGSAPVGDPTGATI